MIPQLTLPPKPAPQPQTLEPPPRAEFDAGPSFFETLTRARRTTPAQDRPAAHDRRTSAHDSRTPTHEARDPDAGGQPTDVTPLADSDPNTPAHAPDPALAESTDQASPPAVLADAAAPDVPTDPESLAPEPTVDAERPVETPPSDTPVDAPTSPEADATTTDASSSVESLNLLLRLGGPNTAQAAASQPPPIASQAGHASAPDSRSRHAAQRSGSHAAALNANPRDPLALIQPSAPTTPEAPPPSSDPSVVPLPSADPAATPQPAQQQPPTSTTTSTPATTPSTTTADPRPANPPPARPAAPQSTPSLPDVPKPDTAAPTLVLRPITGPTAHAFPGLDHSTALGAPATPEPSTAAAHRQELLAAQISRNLAAAAARGGDTLTMRLTPETLGAMTIRVEVHGGAVSASFATQTSEARELLESTMTALRSSLEARGLAVERLQVELAPQSPNPDPSDSHPGAERRPESDDRHSGSRDGSSGDRSAGDDGDARRGNAGEHGARDRTHHARGRTDATAGAAPAPRPPAHPAHLGPWADRGLYLGIDALA